MENSSLNCNVCGAPLEIEGACPFDVPEARALWKGDYEAMAKGLITHLQHQVSVSRWVVHHPEGQSEKVLTHSKALSSENVGVVIGLFPVES